MTKQIFLLAVSVSLLVACGQKVQFGAAIVSSNSKSSVPNPGICGDPTQPTHDVWVPTDAATVTCPGTCPDGTKLNCVQPMEKQIACIEGYPADTGVTRPVGAPQPIGTCPITPPPPPPPPPKACGDHPDGSFWWIDAGTETESCNTCWDGSHLQCVYAVQSQVTCSNGNTESAGFTRKGGLIQTIGTCPAQVADRDEDVTVPVKPAKADILFVLDTTPSMFKTLNGLGNRFHQIFEGWDNVDWQIGITDSQAQFSVYTSEASGGHLMPLQTNDETLPPQYIIKKSDPFAEPYFYRTLSRDESDDGCNTQPFCMLDQTDPMATVIKTIDQRASATNQGFLRPGAHLVVIDVTDKDEHETGGAKATQPSQVLEHYKDVFGSTRESLIALSVIIQPGDAACLERHSNIFEDGLDGHYGPLLDQFASATGGASASVCAGDYSSQLAKIEQSLRNTISTIVLKHTPIPGTLQITFTPAQNAKWTLNGKTVTFSQGIPAGTQIHAHYKVTLPKP